MSAVRRIHDAGQGQSLEACGGPSVDFQARTAVLAEDGEALAVVGADAPPGGGWAACRAAQDHGRDGSAVPENAHGRMGGRAAWSRAPVIIPLATVVPSTLAWAENRTRSPR